MHDELDEDWLEEVDDILLANGGVGSRELDCMLGLTSVPPAMKEGPHHERKKDVMSDADSMNINGNVGLQKRKWEKTK